MNNDYELFDLSMRMIIDKEIEAGRYKSLDLHDNIQDIGAYRCLCCETNLNGISTAVQHARGKRHLKQARVSSTGPVDSLISQFSNFSTSELIQSSSSSNSSSSRDESLERSGNLLENIMDISFEESLKRRILKQEGNGYCCTICNLPLTSYIVAKQHIEGTKHGKKLKNRPNGVNNFEIPFENTLTSSLNQKITASPSPHNNSNKVLEDYSFYCAHCDKSLNSESQLEAHNSGISHLKKVTHRSSLGQINDVLKKENIKTTIDPSPRTEFEDEIIIISAHEILINHPCFAD